MNLDPGFIEAYYNRGWTRGELGDAERAKADYRKAVALPGRTPVQQYYQGLAKEALGDRKGAVESYRRLLRESAEGSNPQRWAKERLKELEEEF